MKKNKSDWPISWGDVKEAIEKVENSSGGAGFINYKGGIDLDVENYRFSLTDIVCGTESGLNVGDEIEVGIVDASDSTSAKSYKFNFIIASNAMPFDGMPEGRPTYAVSCSGTKLYDFSECSDYLYILGMRDNSPITFDFGSFPGSDSLINGPAAGVQIAFIRIYKANA